MKSHLLKLACRPVPSGRLAESACVLPARDCLARRIEPDWFALRGFAVPVRYARPGSSPTAGKVRIRDAAMTDTEPQSNHQSDWPTGAFFRTQALLLIKLTVWRPRNFRVTATRYACDDHRPDSHIYGIATPTNFPRSSHAHGLSTIFPRPRIFQVHVQSAITLHPRSVQCLSNECPRSDQRFPQFSRERCLNCLRNVPSFDWDSPLARKRVVWVCAFRLLSAACQSLSVRRKVFFAFRMAFLASAKVRPNLCCRVVLSGVAGLLYRHSGRRAGLHVVSVVRLSGIHSLAVVGSWLVCPLRQWRRGEVIQQVATAAQSESKRE